MQQSREIASVGMYVTLASRDKVAYIGLGDRDAPSVAESLPLSAWANDAAIPALSNLILDFDERGRLVGIEVMNAKKVLPEALLAKAERI
jgi:hypothetical protein